MKAYKMQNADFIAVKCKLCFREESHIHVISARLPAGKKKWTEVCHIPCETYHGLMSDIIDDLVREGYQVKTEILWTCQDDAPASSDVVMMNENIVEDHFGTFSVPKSDAMVDWLLTPYGSYAK